MKKTIIISIISIVIIAIVVGKGSNVNNKSDLIEAIKKTNEQKVEELIKKGVDVNFIYKDDGTPLMIAVATSNKRVTKQLIKAGANINQNIDNNTIIEDLNPLFLAVLNNDLEMVKLLIERGANVNIKTQHGETILPAAMFDADLEIVKLLINEGVDVNNFSKMGMTPLLFVTSVPESKRVIEVTKLLIEAGAKVNIKDKKLGMTPLMYASKIGNENIVKILLKSGANLSQTNNKGETALDLAKENKNIIKILKKATH